MRLTIFAVFIALISTFNASANAAVDSDRVSRQAVLHDTRGTYCNPPRLENKRVDIRLLVEQLVELKANAYSFCIHPNVHDWEDLQLFLPAAREHGIKVWASVVPPSESPPKGKMSAEPFKLDYERWAVEFAKLSVREPNLVAWSIDDFTHNLSLYTPEKVKKMLDAARAINPKLAFIPCCYFKDIKPKFAEKYEPLLDGILFPYRDESGGANLTKWESVDVEIKKLNSMFGRDFPICIDVYATAHSRLGASTPEYVREVMTRGRASAAGVMVYCHQDPKQQAEKYQIIKKLFNNWSAAPTGKEK